MIWEQLNNLAYATLRLLRLQRLQRQPYAKMVHATLQALADVLKTPRARKAALSLTDSAVERIKTLLEKRHKVRHDCRLRERERDSTPSTRVARTAHGPRAWFW